MRKQHFFRTLQHALLCSFAFLLMIANSASAQETVSVAGGDEFTFLVMADIHEFTPLAFDPNSKDAIFITEMAGKIFENVKENYGGEFIMMPGDSASFGKMRNDEIVEQLGGDLSPNDAVYQACLNCYTRTKELFRTAGYDIVLPSTGDHELGGNDGFRARGRKSKFTTIPSYLRAYVDGYNRKGPNDSAYLFSDPIAGAPARPYGTLFEGSSFAYRFRNVLVISVDAFRTAGSGKKDYIDRSNGYGGEGMITCDVSGDHLAWFEDVLIAAKSDSSIKHIFVESHIPIIQPVRTQQSSGQFMDDADQSAFWKVMNTYGVDIYFAGDVHSTTASKTKESNSNLVQIISSSRFFAGFLTVHVTNDSIQVKHHNEFGEKSRFNNQYIENGMLTITKTSRGEVIQIESYGELELLNDALPLIHLDFENLYPLSTRQVNGLTSNGKLIPDSINIGGVACNESLKNHGSFGKHYDAQTGNIQLVQGRRNGGFSAQMSPDSRLAIFGSGPLGAGRIVSVSMWFKTDHDQDEMVLCHYGSFWGPVPKKKDHLLLTLGRGVPILYIRPGQAYSVAIDSIADGNWHHVALTMPKQNCLSAEIQLFIDGDEYPLESITPWSNDKNVFFLTSGRMSFGGLGYASKRTKEYYMDKLPYEGELDDIKVWSRTLSPGDIRGVSISCDDDVDYKFTLKNGRSVKCGWIQANKKTLKRRERYCYDKSDKESASDIANACPKSCGFCSHD